MKKRLDKHTRAVRYAKRAFMLELFVEDGRTTRLSEKLQGFIRGQIACAWIAGYNAARRENRG